MQESILVTGGAGFVGSNFIRQWLAEKKTPLVNLDKLTYAGNLGSLADVVGDSNYTFVKGDIIDYPWVRQLLEKYRPQIVVNFAAETHVDRSIDSPAAFIETNVVGTFRLLEAVRDYWARLPQKRRAQFRFLHVSTDEVYGSLWPQSRGKSREIDPYRPNSPYAASKAAGDHFVRAYHRTYGLPTLTTNCSNNYGPYQFPEKLIPYMILNALEGKALPVYGDGRQVRDWLHVEDHCRAIHRVLQSGIPGEVYNIGGDCERTNLEVVQLICAALDGSQSGLPQTPCSKLITFVRDRPGHDRRYAIDAEKIRTQLGWEPQKEFQLGLFQTVQWYLTHQTWIEQVTSKER